MNSDRRCVTVSMRWFSSCAGAVWPFRMLAVSNVPTRGRDANGVSLVKIRRAKTGSRREVAIPPR